MESSKGYLVTITGLNGYRRCFFVPWSKATTTAEALQTIPAEELGQYETHVVFVPDFSIVK